MAGPRGMAPAMVKALHDAFAVALHDPAALAALDRYDMPLLYKDTAGYERFARTQYEEEGAAVRALGLRID